jgi:hypothetical protein
MEPPVILVPYSRKPFIKNKKSGEYFKIRILKLLPRHLYPQSTGTIKSTPLWGVRDISKCRSGYLARPTIKIGPGIYHLSGKSFGYSCRYSGSWIILLTAPSHACCSTVASCGVRPHLQRRVRPGFSPGSLLGQTELPPSIN